MQSSNRRTVYGVALRLILFLFFSSSLIRTTLTEIHAQTDDEKTIDAIFNERLASGEMYYLLADLCKNIGPRLSGSKGAEQAVIWAKEVMENYEFDQVYLQEVVVPLSLIHI